MENNVPKKINKQNYEKTYLVILPFQEEGNVFFRQVTAARYISLCCLLFLIFTRTVSASECSRGSLTALVPGGAEAVNVRAELSVTVALSAPGALP